jgi:hypothetical protein
LISIHHAIETSLFGSGRERQTQPFVLMEMANM